MAMGKRTKKSRKTGKPELEPWQTRTKHGQANAKSPNAKETTHVHAEQEGSHKAHRKRNKKRQQGEGRKDPRRGGKARSKGKDAEVAATAITITKGTAITGQFH